MAFLRLLCLYLKSLNGLGRIAQAQVSRITFISCLWLLQFIFFGVNGILGSFKVVPEVSLRLFVLFLMPFEPG
ncbi:hypothetical protein RHMOL_Rhmol05G0185800 [Rhododendron molle]|uniref:Uncharacterized protein n=1 Tax=Rhododendron molle TaxID=49168 RepID=A0ACC0NS30_RHOML|nr:hypothetical protein RHMOL_Rhmol05G0185800 [Rhododendron molle]